MKTEVKPIHRGTTAIRTIVLCALFAALSGVGAFIRVPLPVIPFTLQLLFVLLSGLLLGAKRGALSQCIYLLVGLCGFPVFTKGGGPGYLLEPSFGYLLGFILSAFVVGTLVNRMQKLTVTRLFFAGALAVICDYLVGVLYMWGILNLYMQVPTNLVGALWTGAAVFLPKDLVICFVTALAAYRLIPILKRQGLQQY